MVRINCLLHASQTTSYTVVINAAILVLWLLSRHRFWQFMLSDVVRNRRKSEQQTLHSEFRRKMCCYLLQSSPNNCTFLRENLGDLYRTLRVM